MEWRSIRLIASSRVRKGIYTVPTADESLHHLPWNANKPPARQSGADVEGVHKRNYCAWHVDARYPQRYCNMKIHLSAQAERRTAHSKTMDKGSACRGMKWDNTMQTVEATLRPAMVSFRSIVRASMVATPSPTPTTNSLTSG